MNGSFWCVSMPTVNRAQRTNWAKTEEANIFSSFLAFIKGFKQPRRLVPRRIPRRLPSYSTVCPVNESGFFFRFNVKQENG